MPNLSVLPDFPRRVSLIGGLGVDPMVRLSLSARRLLAYLALRAQPVARRVAAAQLWPDMPEDAGRTNLRRTLWQVPGGWVAAVGEELLLQACCDLPLAHAAAARALDGEPIGFSEIELLCGDVLPGWNEEWLMPAQDAFRLLRVQALEAACRSLAAVGQLALAVQAGTAAVAAEPFSESAAEALIHAHLAQGNRFHAMQCYRLLAERLDEELGVAPDPALQKRFNALNACARLRAS